MKSTNNEMPGRSLLVLALGWFLAAVWLLPVSASAGPRLCVKKKSCLACKQSCLNKHRRAYRNCRKRTKTTNLRRCLASISSRIASCMKKTRVSCSRRCSRNRDRKCSQRCTVSLGRRCNTRYFRNRCKVESVKAYNRCRPAYKKAAKRCCRRGVRFCTKRRVCRKVNCVRSYCPPACQCVGSTKCGRCVAR